MKKTKLIIVAGLIALLSACGDSVVDAGSDSIVQPEAKVRLFVLDQATGIPMEKVSVKVLTTGKTVKTNKDGIANLGKLYTGNYAVQLTIADYATVVEDIEVKGEAANEGGDTYIAPDVTNIIEMYKANATVVGFVHYVNAAQSEVPAKDAEVCLKLDEKFVTYGLNCKTVDADGKYEFTELPGGAGSDELYAKEFKDGARTFAQQDVGSFTTLPGATVFVDKKTLDASYLSSLRLLSGSAADITAATKSVKLSFSEDIDVVASTRKNGSFPVEVTGVTADIAISGKDITVKWEEDKISGTVTVSYTKLVSTSGHGLDDEDLVSGSFTATIVPEDLRGATLAGLAVDKATGDVTFNWDEKYRGATVQIYSVTKSSLDEISVSTVSSGITVTKSSTNPDAGKYTLTNLTLTSGADYDLRFRIGNTRGYSELKAISFKAD